MFGVKQKAKKEEKQKPQKKERKSKRKMTAVEEVMQVEEIIREIKQLQEQLETVTTKKERNKIKKKIDKLKRSVSVGQDGDVGFTASMGYLDKDGFLVLNRNRLKSVYDVLFEYGTNHDAKVGWVTNLIPRNPIPHGEITFVERQRLVDKDTEEDIFSKHLASAEATLGVEQTDDSRERSKNRNRILDIAQATYLAGIEQHIVDSDMTLIVNAKSEEDIEITVDEIKDSYQDSQFQGVNIVRKTGMQLESLRDIFDRPQVNAYHNSDMALVSASRLFLPNSGFSDDDGEEIGLDVSSILPNQKARANFQDVKNAVIFSGGISANVTFHDAQTPLRLEYGGSGMATVIARASWLAGRRTHHILLNEFDYRLPDSLYFDMTKEAINPLEVFGTPETVELDFEANLNKVIAILAMLSKVEDDKYSESEIRTLLYDWYLTKAKGGGIYTNNVRANPRKAQLVLAKQGLHEKYPTLDSLLPVFKNNVAKRRNEGERAGERANFLYNQINNTFTQYKNLSSRTTTLPDVYTANQRNIYYDLSKVSNDKRLKGALLLNTLAYVVNRALDGEMIVIHGLDSVEIKEDLLMDYQEVIRRKNLGKIVVFEQAENEKVNPTTFSRFIKDLIQQDVVILGGLTEKNKDSNAFFKSLDGTVRGTLLAQNEGVFYVYRSSDKTSSIIKTNILLGG